MSIQLNPITQAEDELRAAFHTMPEVWQHRAVIMSIIHRTIKNERLMMEQHPDCGADNPDGKAALCKCHCHTGHYRHAWTPIIKTPSQQPDGTLMLMDRCKYCPDIRLKIIKATWKDEKHTLVSLEYLIRGEQRVLSKEEWLERKPEAQDPKLMRETKP